MGDITFATESKQCKILYTEVWREERSNGIGIVKMRDNFWCLRVLDGLMDVRIIETGINAFSKIREKSCVVVGN